jgi:hypothetical protein
MLILFYLLSTYNNKKASFKGVAMCVIAKNENLYINEFLTYYKNLGIKKIFLYDNNDPFGENFTEVISNDIKSNFVELIDVRGKEEYQVEAYNDCYQKNLNNYSWFLFVDVDEFLYIKNNISLTDFLTDKRFINCCNIHFNYKEFGDSGLLDYDERPIKERFTKNFRYILAIKTIVKGGIKNAKMHIHRSLNVQNYCNSNGEKIIPGDIYTDKITVENAEIRHYITKTIGEFYKRLIRGWPCMKHGSDNYYKFVNHRIDYFFDLNEVTKEKFNKVYSLITDKSLFCIFI